MTDIAELLLVRTGVVRMSCTWLLQAWDLSEDEFALLLACMDADGRLNPSETIRKHTLLSTLTHVAELVSRSEASSHDLRRALVAAIAGTDPRSAMVDPTTYCQLAMDSRSDHASPSRSTLLKCTSLVEDAFDLVRESNRLLVLGGPAKSRASTVLTWARLLSAASHQSLDSSLLPIAHVPRSNVLFVWRSLCLWKPNLNECSVSVWDFYGHRLEENAAVDFLLRRLPLLSDYPLASQANEDLIEPVPVDSSTDEEPAPTPHQQVERPSARHTFGTPIWRRSNEVLPGGTARKSIRRATQVQKDDISEEEPTLTFRRSSGIRLAELIICTFIMAVLASVLFPVFADAKLAAKKTVSFSNQKQIGLGLIMYAGDNDDYYPRSDGCTLNDSLNESWNVWEAGTDPSPFCNGSGINGVGGFAFRDNYMNWQKFTMPYLKDNALFVHPLIEKDPYKWNQGQLSAGYALNIALTGAVSTWSGHGAVKLKPRSQRLSYLGGCQANIPSPEEAMIVMELANTSLVGGIDSIKFGTTVATYPLAIKEHWRAYFHLPGGAGRCGETETIDRSITPFGFVPLSYADGHIKTIQVGQFLARTPTSEEYGISFDRAVCQIANFYWFNDRDPSWTTPWPMWGLQ